MMRKKVLLVFPPNWSACVSGPHLALPLLAGSISDLDVHCQILDLSNDFYSSFLTKESNYKIHDACSNEDFNELDNLYFEWEDSIASSYKNSDLRFGLLSGFHGPGFMADDIASLYSKVQSGTPYSYYYKSIYSKLHEFNPEIVGISISSHYQLSPVLELIHLLKIWFPDVRIVLGGNTLTRLKGTRSLKQIESLVDRVFLYQGDLQFREYVKGHLGQSENNVPNQNIDYQDWAIPKFSGLNVGNYPGLVNTIPYVSTRGCYYGKCSFCAIPAGWSKSGYAGSAPAIYAVDQIQRMIEFTQIPRVKFVDEAFSPSKAKAMYHATKDSSFPFVWEAYARVEKAWESYETLQMAYDSGCRRLYFGLEIAPDGNRAPLSKNDHGDIIKIIERCNEIGILIHLFCMVGHPATNQTDAELTVKFLIEYQDFVDTADLVGFRLDRGTIVPGVKKRNLNFSDFAMSYEYDSVDGKSLNYDEVFRLEADCQEVLWSEVPRLLHPLYRIGRKWPNETVGTMKFEVQNKYSNNA